jgi:filamentous hemagglutinin family protein
MHQHISTMKLQSSTSFISALTLLLASLPTIVQAQITPDTTFGAESSRLTPNVLIQGVNADRVDGGATRGGNLFHSFSQFNVADGQRLYFANPIGIQTIFTRVTGNTLSNINGTLGVDGAASLFLLNPNGILFGPNAQLDMGGSFIGTTASGVQFGNQGAFTVNQTDAPLLLTIQPSALAFTQQSTGSIVSRSVAAAGISPSGRNLLGLQVPTGQSLILAGGDVQIDGGGINGGLNAQGGRIELGGLVAPGSIGLDSASGQPKLVFSNDGTRGNVSLVNNARVAVRGNGGGDVAVNANLFTAADGGRIVAGIEGIGDAGEINVKANMVNFSGESLDGIGANSGLSNQVFPTATGRGGAIKINTNKLTLTSGAQIDTITFGQGGGGDILINARESILIDAISRLPASTNIARISTNIQNDPNGAAVQGGKSQITTGTLTMLNGAQISSGNAGRGNAGDILVNAKTITLQGKSENENGKFPSAFISLLDTNAIGNAGNISVQTDSLNILDGAAIDSSTRGNGNAGNIKILAKGSVLLSEALSGIISGSQKEGIGEGGNIQIEAATLTLANQSSIDSNVRGQGNGGSISIDVEKLIDLKSSGIRTSSTGEGNAGSINITAGNLLRLDKSLISASVSSFNGSKAIGNAGEISLKASSIFITDLSSVTSDTSTFGNGGAINIIADKQIVVDGGSKGFSLISSTVNEEAIGKGSISPFSVEK